MSTAAIKELLGNKAKLEEVSKKAFDAIDIDKSKTLEHDEVKRVLMDLAVSIGSEPPSDEDTNEFMKKLDTNSDNKIDANEFLELVRMVLEAMVVEEDDF